MEPKQIEGCYQSVLCKLAVDCPLSVGVTKAGWLSFDREHQPIGKNRSGKRYDQSSGERTEDVANVPAEYHDPFEKSMFAHPTTMAPDGKPHATPVWIDHDGDANRLLINTERGRRKERNVANNPTSP